MTPSQNELPRAIGFPRATALVVGTIVGASIFVPPAAGSRELASVPGMLLVWTAAGLLTLVGALVTAELASAFPRTGGVYVFLAEAFSPLVGFLWCWAMFWSMHTGIIAALATVCAHYLGYFVPLGNGATRAVGVAVIIVLSAVNYVGVSHGSSLQAALTAIKAAAIAFVIVVGAAYALGGTPTGGGASHATVAAAALR